MECPNCKKELIIPRNAYRNLETYHPGGTVLVASECCGAGYLLKQNISYKLTPYTGDLEEDEWGREITKTK